jgi:hypothetical protein
MVFLMIILLLSKIKPIIILIHYNSDADSLNQLPHNDCHYLYLTGFIASLFSRIPGDSKFQAKKSPIVSDRAFFLNKSLAMTYFHMGKPHTIIGAERFHF